MTIFLVVMTAAFAITAENASSTVELIVYSGTCVTMASLAAWCWYAKGWL